VVSVQLREDVPWVLGASYYLVRLEVAQVAIVLEPLSELTVVWELLFDDLPEPRRMILLPDMSQFMDDHIIDDGEGSHHEAPGEGQGILSGTSPPLVLCRGDPISSGADLNSVLIMLNSLTDDRFSLLSIPLNEKILCPIPEACSQAEQALSKHKRPLILVVLSHLQRVRLTQIEEPFTRDEFLQLRMFLLFANLGEFPVDPMLLFFDKAMDRLLSDSQRYTYDDRSIPFDAKSQSPSSSFGSNDLVTSGFVHLLPGLRTFINPFISQIDVER